MGLNQLEMKKLIALVILVSMSFAGCEKDDICDPATTTTPRLVLEFFDRNNVSLPKATTNLRIVGVGVDGDLPPLRDENGQETWNASTVFLPLRVNVDSTKFKLTLNVDTNPATQEQTDVLEINYSRNETYISRACGFKASFDLLGSASRAPFVLNETPNITTGNWIRNIRVLQSQINDENEVHIQIFF